MLRSLLAYTRGAGVDTRWVVIGGDAGVLRDHQADPQPPARVRRATAARSAPAERAVYEAALRADAAASSRELRAARRRRDPPRPADRGHGRAAARGRGARSIWRCARRRRRARRRSRARRGTSCGPTWPRPTRTCSPASEFVWDGLDAPSTSRSSRRRSTSSRRRTRSSATSTVARDPRGRRASCPDGDRWPTPSFLREDGTPGRVDRRRRSSGAPLRRRRPLRRPGLALGPAQGPGRRAARLRAARRRGAATRTCCSPGPAVDGGRRRPRGRRGARGGRRRRRALPAPPARARAPRRRCRWTDAEENAAMVNAIQRRADVVVQKTLAEGFGLTVAEAMWKARPVVAASASAASRTRSSTASAGCCSTTRATSPPSATRSAGCWPTRELAGRLGDGGARAGARALPRAAPPRPVGRGDARPDRPRHHVPSRPPGGAAIPTPTHMRRATMPTTTPRRAHAPRPLPHAASSRVRWTMSSRR